LLKTGQNASAIFNNCYTNEHNYDTLASIDSQARNLASKVGSHSNKLILVGHSQGGLRARQFAQYYRYLQPGANLYGLVTVDSPNQGAPIIVNLPGKIASIDINLRLATFPIIAIAESWANCNLECIIRQQGNIAVFGPEAGLQDMRPGSEFLKQLNNTYCRWESRIEYRWVGPPGDKEQVAVTVWYEICTTGGRPGFSPIPSNVWTASIIGTNNNVYAMTPEISQYISYIGGIGSVATPIWTAALVLTLGFSAAPLVAAISLVNEAANFQSNWMNQVVGSTQGDAVVPAYSQNMYNNLSTGVIGGAGAFTYNVNATHGGNTGTSVLRNNETLRSFQDYQRRVFILESR